VCLFFGTPRVGVVNPEERRIVDREIQALKAIGQGFAIAGNSA
jgi:hypothetical protein